MDHDTPGHQAIDLASGDYHTEKVFSSLNWDELDIENYSFDNCRFVSCRFPDKPITGESFRSCVFDTCEFVLTPLKRVSLVDVRFESCKLVGINFSDCNPFGFSLDMRECTLQSTVFYNLNLRKQKMTGCSLRECDFGECDMRESDFSLTRFERTTFHNCNLQKADFRSSSGYEIDPATNQIRRARFTLPEARSFLGFLGISLED